MGVECRLGSGQQVFAWCVPSENDRVWQFISEGTCPQHGLDHGPGLQPNGEWAECSECGLQWRLVEATHADR